MPPPPPPPTLLPAVSFFSPSALIEGPPPVCGVPVPSAGPVKNSIS